MTSGVLERLRNGLIVSVQAAAGSPLDDPHVIGAIAEAAQRAGASGVRVAGMANIAEVRRRVTIPIVGITKRAYPGFEVYITPTMREAGEALSAGAEIVAFDVTGRRRPDGAADAAMVRAIHEWGALAMADCAQPNDGRAAVEAGADIVATTLCGYTKETEGAALPSLELTAAFSALGAFTICEGGVQSPQEARAALQAGAAAVVVGTAITNIEWRVRSYIDGMQRSW